MATYLDIPKPNDILSVSQVNIRDNFTYLKQALIKDHNIDFNTSGSTSGIGIHNQVSLIIAISANPALTSGADSMVYSYNKNLYWKNSTTPAGVPLTVTNASVPTVSANGVTFLPGGLLLQWGKSTTTSAAFPAAPTVTFPVAFSATPYSIQCSIFENYDGSVNVQVVTATSSNFKVTTREGGKVSGVTYTWMAIGKA